MCPVNVMNLYNLRFFLTSSSRLIIGFGLFMWGRVRAGLGLGFR